MPGACGFALVACCFPGATRAESQPVILILGDSLSAGYGVPAGQGWVSLLKEKLGSEKYSYAVVNASISGETTGGGRSRLPDLVKKYHPEILVIELGANDGLRGHPVNVLRENLAAMVETGQNAHARVLLVAVPIPPNYGPAYTAQYNQGFRDISRTHHTAFAPSLLGKVPLDASLMQADGLHPTAAAQPALLDHVWPTLKPLLIKK